MKNKTSLSNLAGKIREYIPYRSNSKDPTKNANAQATKQDILCVLELLLKKNILTQEEFDAEKRKLFDIVLNVYY